MRNPNTAKAYEFLRKRILSGDLQPGAFLSAQSLAKDIGVSRTPVREALRQLENDELVTIVPKLGAVVKTLNKEQFQDLLGYREALEAYTAGRAAELRHAEEVEQLRLILEKMHEVSRPLIQDPGDREALQNLGEQDVKFHRAIFGMARNNFIRERFERAHILQRMMTLSLLSHLVPGGDAIKENVAAVLEEHTRIFEAIRDGDAERAHAAMTRHMSNFSAKVRRGGSAPTESLTPASIEVLI